MDNLILIEEYRGWAIYYSRSRESFQVQNDALDTQIDSRSTVATCKTAVDEYIKKNETFTPFKIQRIADSYTYGVHYIDVVGIRKDGRFLVVKKEGQKPSQLSEYDEKDYRVVTTDKDQVTNNNGIYLALSKIKEQGNILAKQAAEIREGIVYGDTLRDKKRQLGY